MAQAARARTQADGGQPDRSGPRPRLSRLSRRLSGPAGLPGLPGLARLGGGSAPHGSPDPRVPGGPHAAHDPHDPHDPHAGYGPPTAYGPPAAGSADGSSAAAGRRGRWGRWGRDARGRGTWRRGLVPALLAAATAVLLVLHAEVPNRVGNLGSLLETFLPWLGLALPVLLVWGLLRRSALALAVLLLPVLLWADLFGGLLSDRSAAGGDLTVLSHNVDAQNADPAATARAIVASHADVVALEELTATALPVYERALAAAYPYRTVRGTVALWSRYPVTGTRAVDIKIGWVRALRTEVRTPRGPLAVYVAHLPSVRVKFDAGFTADQRDNSADALGEAIADERLGRVVLLGDLNGTMNDRSLADITSQMRSAQGAAGDGMGFSWPASFPLARIDQIMTKGVTPVSSWVLPSTGSDHLPVAARVRL